MQNNEEKSIRPCANCGTPSEHVVVLMGGKRYFDDAPTLCDPCIEAERIKEAEKKEEERLAGVQAVWEGICPPLYQNTEMGNPRLSRAAWAALRAWEPNGVQGLGLIGETGKGKTRLAFARLKELHFKGHKVFAVSAKKIERAIQDTFSDDRETRNESRKLMNETLWSGILLLDDLGKEKYTERVASEFYALVEERTSNLLPTIWTANTSATELKKRMGSEHGDATVRRLMEFSTIITV